MIEALANENVVYQVGDAVIDLLEHTVSVNRRIVAYLSVREVRILDAMLRRGDGGVELGMLLQVMYGNVIEADHSRLSTALSYLRRKLKRVGLGIRRGKSKFRGCYTLVQLGD